MDDTVTDKTLYDGRMQFHRRLDSLWTAYHNYSLLKDYNGVWTALSGVLGETSGLIPKGQTEEFAQRLDNIYTKARLLNNGQKINPLIFNDFLIQKEFRKLVIDIREVTKSLYLPLEEFDTGFDEKKFLDECEG